MLVRELNLGGCERDVTRLALGIDRTRYQPHVAAIHPRGLRADELKAAGVPIVELKFRSFLKPEVVAAGRQTLRYCAERGIRILHAWDIPMTLFAAPVGAFGSGLKVLTSQLSYRKMYRGWEQRLLWGTDRLSDRVAVNCQTIIDELHALHGMPAGKTALIYNGVDLKQFHPRGRSRAILPRGFRDAAMVVGSVCALRSEKRLGDLVEAFAAAGAAERDWRLVIVGSGVELEGLQRSAQDLGIAELCHFEPQTAQVADWDRALDVFVMCSDQESFPNGPLEAMACGCAVIGSDVGGVAEMIEDGASGLIFPARDVPALAEKLMQMSDAGQRRAFAEAGARRAVEEFSAERFCRSYEDLYDELLAPRRK